MQILLVSLTVAAIASLVLLLPVLALQLLLGLIGPTAGRRRTRREPSDARTAWMKATRRSGPDPYGNSLA